MALLAWLVGKVPCTMRVLLIYTVLTGVFFLYSQVSALPNPPLFSSHGDG